MVSSIKRFLREEDGVTALEYGLLAAVIAGAIVAAHETIEDFFESIFTTLKGLVEAEGPAT
ncbi:Flp family type IVb pilin [Pseudomonas sp. Hp2]|uniref:Flp family type IVb pilin n=1 Tax=Pseudomonas sp. Hp2 TaxID=701189 RepID=UPI001129E318|nr:Flp family type IVb pilin [Pseudomonas sp. Hp2]